MNPLTLPICRRAVVCYGILDQLKKGGILTIACEVPIAAVGSYRLEGSSLLAALD
jgi:hypothetical protein